MRFRRKDKAKDDDGARPMLSKSNYIEDGWRIRPPKGYRFVKVESSAVRIAFKLKPE